MIVHVSVLVVTATSTVAFTSHETLERNLELTWDPGKRRLDGILGSA